jgi:hypothetical protein
LNDSKQLKDRAKDSLATAREIRKENKSKLNKRRAGSWGEKLTRPRSIRFGIFWTPTPQSSIYFGSMAEAENPVHLILGGLRTDADLLRKLLALIPPEEQAVRETVLREIESKIRQLELMLSLGVQTER